MSNFETGNLSLETNEEASRRIQDGSKVIDSAVEIPTDLALQDEVQAAEDKQKAELIVAELSGEGMENEINQADLKASVQEPEVKHETHVDEFKRHQQEVAQVEYLTRLKNSPKYREEMRLVETVQANFHRHPDVQRFIQESVVAGRDAYSIRNGLLAGPTYSKGYTLEPGWREAAQTAGEELLRGLDKIATKY